MELEIFAPDLRLAGVMDGFTSLSWTSRWRTAGEFTLEAPLTSASLALLRRDSVVLAGGRSGYIESVELSMEEDGETVTARGRDLLGYLARRINWGAVDWSGPAEGFLRKLVNDNCIACAAPRVIPGLVLAPAAGFPGDIARQDSFGNLLEVLEAVAAGSELGFRIRLNAPARTMTFEVYQGMDRSAAGPDPLILSRGMENILSQTYLDSANGYANTALIGGGGEGADRTTAAIEAGEGLGRYEIFVDAGDVISAAGNPPLTPEEYQAQLLQRGREALAERPILRTLDGAVNHLARLDFGLGDLVTVSDPSWGVAMDARVTELQEIFENAGTTVNAVFGAAVPTLTDKIRKGMI